MNTSSNTLLAAAICLSACATHKAVANSGIVIVFYDSAVGNSPLKKAAKRFGSTTVYDYHTLNGMALSVPYGKTVDEAIEYYRAVNGVLSVSRDEKMQLQ